MAFQDLGVCNKCLYNFRRELCYSCLDYKQACKENLVKPVWFADGFVNGLRTIVKGG